MPVFMDWMKAKAEAHAKAYPDKLSMETVDGVKTFGQFNSRITAPVFGFSSVEVGACAVFFALSCLGPCSCSFGVAVFRGGAADKASQIHYIAGWERRRIR